MGASGLNLSSGVSSVDHWRLGGHGLNVVTRGMYPRTGRRDRASGRFDLRVRSVRRMPSEGVRALFVRRVINRSLGQHWAGS